MKNNPKVSVVVTTKNEEKNIGNCLESINAQTYKNIEIIVVDNNSSDKTKQIAKKYTDRVYDKGPERSSQRNFGMIKKSTGIYVIFIDADMILAPNLIESCINFIDEHKCLALHIPEIVLGKNFFSQVRRFERIFYNGTSIDGARFFAKSEFTCVGGFDESMSGPEDWDIDKKIKKIGKICLLETPTLVADWKMDNFIKNHGVDYKNFGAIIYHNEAEFNLKKYLDKKGYYAKSFEAYIKKWGARDPDVKKQFGLYYRYVGVFIEKGKWKKLLAHPILTLGMLYLRFLVGIKYIFKN